MRGLTLALAATGLAVWLVTGHVAGSFVVAGSSMEPVLRAGDRVVVDLWTYRRRPPAPGEIALLYDPRGAPLVKRVVVRKTDGTLEVIGDNPGQSRDSRSFGPVPPDRVVGRVLWRYWPPSRLGPIR